MADDPLTAIVSLLEREHGINRGKLSPSSRLLHDLRVDGDDAIELIQEIRKRFGTDFTALEGRWSQHFRAEGGSYSNLGVWVVCFTIIFLVLSMLNVQPIVVMVFSLVLSFFCARYANRFLLEREMHPVTISELANAVRRGAWSRETKIDS